MVACRKGKKESFNDCVDREVTDDLLPEFGCIPPWLSLNNQCNEIYAMDSQQGNIFHYTEGSLYENYTIPFLLYDQNKAQKKCKKPCHKTTFFIERRRKQVTDYVIYGVDLLFNTEVSFKKKVVAYDMFNFVVDVGSSLGLWLGLSILNITDSIINLVSSLHLNKLLFR